LRNVLFYFILFYLFILFASKRSGFFFVFLVLKYR